MKTQKWFAMALALLTFVGFTACKDKSDDDELLVITPSSLTLKVGEKATLTANAEDVTWKTSDEKVVALEGGGGKTMTVVAIAKGSAIITATTSDGVTKTCVVAVKAEGGEGQGAVIEAKRIWPIFLDVTTFEANKDLVAYDFRPNPDAYRDLFVWNGYDATTATGANFYGLTEDYVALVVKANAGWSGAGVALTAGVSDPITDEQQEGVDKNFGALNEMVEAIKANPDKFFVHMAIKSTNAGNHEFWLFDADGRGNVDWNLGTAVLEQGKVVGDFDRDGEWHEFDIALSQFDWSTLTIGNKANLFAFLSGGVEGTLLFLDAVYIYEKE